VAGVVVAAAPDTGNATAGTAATPIANVLANDTVDGVPATTSNSTLTVVTPASDAGVVLDTATGAVTTTAAVPSGTYTITYQLCNKATPAVCATSTATVTVTAVVPTTGDGVSKVPTLSEYGLMMLSGLLAALGLPALRRRQHRNLNG
jgi:flagellar hook assembly protein FlgD